MGTIFQLRNSINQKNIGNKPENDVNAHEDFFQQVVESHVLAAAMEFLGMEDIEDDPHAEIFPPTLWMLERKSAIQSCYQYVETLLISSQTSVRLKQFKMQMKNLIRYLRMQRR